jgi:2-oxoglutarate dehydrogenase E2 component (dihydrolipoamide succinyltransferase)
VLDITIPKLNTVDTTYTLVEWLFPEGAKVPADAPVVVVETSKAAEELACPGDGVLHRVVDPPAECGLGAIIGQVFSDEDEYLACLAKIAAGAEETGSTGSGGSSASGAGPVGGSSTELIVTNAARDLMNRHGLTDEQLRSLGKKVVKTADVEQLLAGAGVSEPRHLPSRAQRAVAEVVSESHRTIPAASAVVKVDASVPAELQRRFAARERVPIGMPELLVKCVAALHADFPLFFASMQADGTALAASEPHVGVTVDVGTGLYIPVVKHAARSGLRSVARTLLEFRVKALRRQFRESDLTGGNIAISVNDDPAVVFVQPLILPPQVCMLTLCAAQEELYLDAGEVKVRRYVHIGLSYDHRLINGRQAGQFLTELKSILEDPGRLGGLDEGEPGLDEGRARSGQDRGQT